jgi:hypothetical protein
MSAEHRWNDTDRVIQKDWGKIRFEFHFFHHKCYINWPGTRGGPVLFPCLEKVGVGVNVRGHQIINFVH